MAGVDRLRRDFTERHEDKRSLIEPRMRNLESCLTEAEVTQHQDIQVKCTRAVRDAGGAIAAEVTLNAEKCLEQRTWGEISLKSDDRVDEARLVSVTHRFC